MALVSDLITQAYRESNLIPVGTTPTTDEQTEGLARLNGYIGSVFGTLLGVQLQDWPTPPLRTAPDSANRYPPAQDMPADKWPYPEPNSRLITKVTSATTIYLPPDPSDGARLAFVDTGSTADVTFDGNGRNVQDSASLTLTTATIGNREWFYRADLADWTEIKTLALTDESPLPDDFDDLLILALTLRMSARVGKEAGIARNDIRRLERAVRTRYKQRIPITTGSQSKVGLLYGRLGGIQ